MHHCENDYAVSEILGVIFVLTTMTTAISMTLFWAIPSMDEAKANERVQSVINQFRFLDDAVNDVIGQSGNSSRIVNLAVDSGKLGISGVGDRFVVYYSLWYSQAGNFSFNVSGMGDADNRKFWLNISDRPLLYSFYINISYIYLNENERINVGGNQGEDTPIIKLITTRADLVDFVRIDIICMAPTQISLFGGGWHGSDYKESIVGRIWLSDSGAIHFDTASSSGSRRVVYENNGVISTKQSKKQLDLKPSFYDGYFEHAKKVHEYESWWFHHGNPCYMQYMRFIQLRPDSDIVSSSGRAIYKIMVKNNYSVIAHETRIATRGEQEASLYLQIFGDNADVWREYFRSIYCAVEDVSENTLRFVKTIYIVLDFSRCDIGLERLG